MKQRIRWLWLICAVVAALGVGGCRKKPVEVDETPPQPDKAGRVPMAGGQGQAGGGSAQIAQPSTE